MTQRPRRRLGGALVGIALLLPGLVASPVAATPVEDKRAEARQVAATLERLAERASLLNEDLNVARLELGRVETALDEARAATARIQARFRRVHDRAQARAVEAYVSGGGLSRVAALLTGGGNELLVRNEYLRSAAGDDRSALDALRAAESDLAEEQRRLDDHRTAAREARASVEARGAEAERAVAEQRGVLGRVHGELASLVRAEEARRAEETARRARAELAAREARERATREAAARAAEARAAEARAARRTPSLPRPRAVPAPPRPPATEGGSSPAPASGAGAAVAEARRQVGKPYRYGAGGPDAFDCSGLTSWAWRAGGVSLPHSSRAQFSSTTRVAASRVAPGDLLFYGDPIHHVGIYVGGGQMVEASQTGYPVRYASIYRSDLVGVGRPA